jgi:hypothetical protein
MNLTSLISLFRFYKAMTTLAQRNELKPIEFLKGYSYQIHVV